MVDEIDLRIYLTHPHPSVRVCARLALNDHETDDAVVRASLLTCPPVREILDAQYPDGYWMHRDLGISPHYRATVWQVLFLAQLGVGPIAHSLGSGARMHLPVQVRRALEHVLRYNCDDAGALRLRHDAPSLALTGAVLWAVARMGATHAGEWSPTWAWVTAQVEAGPVPVAGALWISRAARAWGRVDWLATYEPWRQLTWSPISAARLTFPLALDPDLLAMMEMACEIDMPELIPAAALDWLQSRRLASRAWPLERVPGRLWCDVGQVGAGNPWVTVRALSVLAHI